MTNCKTKKPGRLLTNHFLSPLDKAFSWVCSFKIKQGQGPLFYARVASLLRVFSYKQRKTQPESSRQMSAAWLGHSLMSPRMVKHIP